MKHSVTIRVADADGRGTTVLKGAEKRISTRLLKWLFGGYTNVFLLSPGQTVQSVNISEIKEEKQNEQ